MIPTRFAVLACLLVAFAAHAPAQQDLRATLFADADRALEQARSADAELLAPAAFARGAEAYAGAEADFARGRNMERIRERADVGRTLLHGSGRGSRDRQRDARRRHQDARGRYERRRRYVCGRAVGRGERELR